MREEAGAQGGGREGAQRGDQTPRQLWLPQNKSLLWAELTRLSRHCIYRMEQEFAITFHFCGLHIAVLYKPAHIKAEPFTELFPGSGVLISS